MIIEHRAIEARNQFPRILRALKTAMQYEYECVVVHEDRNLTWHTLRLASS